tara:strand:- start:846 stop:1121 length:276 start_codon:yes stop_codon:yes gene_type:complete
MITLKQAVETYAASGIHMTQANLRRIAAAWSGVVYAGQGGYAGSVVDYHGGHVPIYRTLLPTSEVLEDIQVRKGRSVRRRFKMTERLKLAA